MIQRTKMNKKRGRGWPTFLKYLCLGSGHYYHRYLNNYFNSYRVKLTFIILKKSQKSQVPISTWKGLSLVKSSALHNFMSIFFGKWMTEDVQTKFHRHFGQRQISNFNEGKIRLNWPRLYLCNWSQFSWQFLCVYKYTQAISFLKLYIKS